MGVGRGIMGERRWDNVGRVEGPYRSEGMPSRGAMWAGWKDRIGVSECLLGGQSGQGGRTV